VEGAAFLKTGELSAPKQFLLFKLLHTANSNSKHSTLLYTYPWPWEFFVSKGRAVPAVLSGKHN